MVWPEWYSRALIEFVVVENLAGIVHVVASLVFAILGCHARVFWAYLFYQLLTTAAKTVVFPEHTLADWAWDLGGDTFEYLIGVGVAEILGLTSRIEAQGLAAKACSSRGVLAGLAVVLLLWLAAFLSALA